MAAIARLNPHKIIIIAMIWPPVNATAVAPSPTSEVPPVNGAASIETIPIPIPTAFTLY